MTHLAYALAVSTSQSSYQSGSRSWESSDHDMPAWLATTTLLAMQSEVAHPSSMSARTST